MTRRRPETPQEEARRGNRMVEQMFGDIRVSKGKELPFTLDEPLRKVRAPRKASEVPSEHQEQAAVIEWWGQQCKAWNYPRKCLFAIPNAQLLVRSAENKHAVMNYLRAEGFRDGMLDLMLAIPARGYHGLLIEMKRQKGGVVSEEQAEMLDMFVGLGYLAQVQNGYEQAVQAIRWYLGK